MRLSIIILALGTVSSVGLNAHTTDDSVKFSIIDNRISERNAVSLPFENPALVQFKSPRTLTSVEAGYDYWKDNGMIDTRRGDGYNGFYAGAETFTKYRNSTLHGKGKYYKGIRNNVKWNETADSDVIYPYILADSVGGDINCETYDFNAGYAVCSGRFVWGASLSYTATFEFRDVDPRPRNIVGVLDVSVGGGLKVIEDYYASLAVCFRKYKQTNEIEFKNEMGNDKAYHLTGLGTHYSRFDGTALSTYYDGYRYGVSADLFPSSSRGGYASCKISQFTFSNILTQFNNLPLASAWHNSIMAETGWLWDNKNKFGAVSFRVDVYCRHGTENIFGDSSSGIYPQIGANTLFADNQFESEIKCLYGVKFVNGSRISARFSSGYNHRTVAYISPYQYTETNTAQIALEVQGTFSLKHGWLLDAKSGIELGFPFDSSAQLSSVSAVDEMSGLLKIEENVYQVSISRSVSPDLSIHVGRPVYEKYTLDFGLSWKRTSFSNGPHTNAIVATVSLLF